MYPTLYPSERITNPHSLHDCPVRYRLPSLLYPYASVFRLQETMDENNKGRGLIAQQTIAPGTSLIQETAFVWQMDKDHELRWRHDLYQNELFSESLGSTMTASSSSSPSLPITSSSSSSVRTGTIDTTIADALLYQMAPYAYTQDILMRIRLRPVNEKEVIEATMKANSFRIIPMNTHGSNNNGDKSEDNTANASSTATVAEGEEEVVDEGRALFSIICLTNHSCQPNSKVYQTNSTHDVSFNALTPSSPPVYTLETRLPVTEGEEITIAYLPRSWDKHKRQQYIQTQWNFTCACERCSLPWDDVYAAKCSYCTEGFIYGGAMNCSVCGETIDRVRMEQLLGGTMVPLPWSSVEDATSSSSSSSSSTSSDPNTVTYSTYPNPLESLLSSPLPIDKLAYELIHHPLLAYHDIRLFTALNQLLPIVSDEYTQETERNTKITKEEGANEGEQSIYGKVYQDIVQTLVQGALQSSYTSPEDLGITIDTTEDIEEIPR